MDFSEDIPEQSELCRMDMEESEIHLFQCDELTSEPALGDQMKQIKYEDIFGSLGEQIKAVKVWRKIFKLRERKLEERKLSLGHQEHHQSASLRCSSQQGVDLSHQDSSTNVELMYQYDLGY